MIRLISAIAITLFAAMHPAAAQETDAFREQLRKTIAVVDMQIVLRDSKAAKSLQTQLEAQRQRYQGQIKSEEDRLRTAEEQLMRQQNILAPDAYAEKRKEFSQQLARVQQDVQGKKQELEKSYAAGMQQIQQELAQAVGKIAEDRGLVMVIPRAQVLLVESKLDITEEVMAALDNRLTTVKLQAP